MILYVLREQFENKFLLKAGKGQISVAATCIYYRHLQADKQLRAMNQPDMEMTSS